MGTSHSIDGLSIPFFNLGRGVQSRTATLTYTWTRTRTGALPDWVFYARRSENATDAVSATATNVDVERGVETHGKPEQTGIGPSSGAHVANPVAAVKKVETVIGDGIHGSGAGDQVTEPTQVCFPLFLSLLVIR